MFHILTPEQNQSPLEPEGPRFEIDPAGALHVVGLPHQGDAEGATSKPPLPLGEVVADLRQAFPALQYLSSVDVRAEFQGPAGLWTGPGPAHCMPDGAPIFDPERPDSETHRGAVHEAFLAWLARRGWACRGFGNRYFMGPEPGP